MTEAIRLCDFCSDDNEFSTELLFCQDELLPLTASPFLLATELEGSAALLVILVHKEKKNLEIEIHVAAGSPAAGSGPESVMDSR